MFINCKRNVCLKIFFNAALYFPIHNMGKFVERNTTPATDYYSIFIKYHKLDPRESDQRKSLTTDFIERKFKLKVNISG